MGVLNETFSMGDWIGALFQSKMWSSAWILRTLSRDLARFASNSMARLTSTMVTYFSMWPSNRILGTDFLPPYARRELPRTAARDSKYSMLSAWGNCCNQP